MNLQEFKAWFEGFTDVLEGCPNEKQWEKIKERIKEIDGTPITEKIYVDRYYPTYPYYPYYYNHPWNVLYCGGTKGFSSGLEGCSAQYLTSQNNLNTNEVFDSCQAMYTLGKAEFTC